MAEDYGGPQPDVPGTGLRGRLQGLQPGGTGASSELAETRPGGARSGLGAGAELLVAELLVVVLPVVELPVSALLVAERQGAAPLVEELLVGERKEGDGAGRQERNWV